MNILTSIVKVKIQHFSKKFMRKYVIDSESD